MAGCNPFATHFDVLVEYAAQAGGRVTATVLNNALNDGAISDLEYLDLDTALDDGCTLADVVSVASISGSGGVSEATANATVSTPGTSSVAVSVEFSLGSETTTVVENITDGDTIQHTFDGVSGGTYQFCADVVDTTAVASSSF